MFFFVFCYFTNNFAGFGIFSDSSQRDIQNDIGSVFSGTTGSSSIFSVVLVEDEVTGIGFRGRLVVQTAHAEYPADYVILATGAPRVAPRISGLSEKEGKGVSYCAVCDAFFYREKDVAVLGAGEYALHEVGELLPVVGSVTLLTNGEMPQGAVPDGVRLDTRKVSAIEGENAVERVRFEDGSTLAVAGVFVAMGVAGSAEIARKVGAAIQGNRIVVDENMATSVPGLFAAGDCTGGMLQVAKAVYEGAKAGTAVVRAARAAQ